MITEIADVFDGVEKAKKILLSGGLVGMPTETVYGLAADGTNPEAVKKIFEVKGRPSDNPLIAHIHKENHSTSSNLKDSQYCHSLWN